MKPLDYDLVIYSFLFKLMEHNKVEWDGTKTHNLIYNCQKAPALPTTTIPTLCLPVRIPLPLSYPYPYPYPYPLTRQRGPDGPDQGQVMGKTAR